MYLGKKLDAFYRTMEDIAWIPGHNCFAAGKTTLDDIKDIVKTKVDKYPEDEVHRLYFAGVLAEGADDASDGWSSSGDNNGSELEWEQECVV